MTDEEDAIFDAEDEFEFENPGYDDEDDGEFELFRGDEDRVGFTVVGEFTGTVDFGYGDVYVVDEFSSEIAHGFPGNTVLTGEFEKIEEGDVVRVEYLGMKQGEDETRDPYHNYDVKVGRKKDE